MPFVGAPASSVGAPLCGARERAKVSCMHRWLLLAAALACNTFEPSPPTPAAAPAAGVRAADNPLLQHAVPAEQQTWLEGAVEESLTAGSYVYLKVRAADQPPVWVASLAITTPATRHVRVLVLGRAERFTSRRLARDFSPLLFGAVRAAPDTPTPSKGTAS
jgi:hypothetical protein